MRVFGGIRPHIPEASDGILTSAGICEGFAGAGVSPGVLLFAGFAGLVAGTVAMGTVEYSKLRAEYDRKAAQLVAERGQLETAPDAELDELTRLYVSRGLSPDLARRVAIELTAHDALAAHAEAEHGITAASRISPLPETLAMSAAFAAGAVLPWLAIVLIPGPYRVPVTFVVVLAALGLTGWVTARTSQVRPIVPMVRTAIIGGLSMLITYFAGHLFFPLRQESDHDGSRQGSRASPLDASCCYHRAPRQERAAATPGTVCRINGMSDRGDVAGRYHPPSSRDPASSSVTCDYYADVGVLDW